MQPQQRQRSAAALLGQGGGVRPAYRLCGLALAALLALGPIGCVSGTAPLDAGDVSSPKTDTTLDGFADDTPGPSDTPDTPDTGGTLDTIGSGDTTDAGDTSADTTPCDLAGCPCTVDGDCASGHCLEFTSGWTCGVCNDPDGDLYGIGDDCIATDCDEGESSANAGAVEVCDTIDNDCDGATDPGCEAVAWCAFASASLEPTATEPTAGGDAMTMSLILGQSMAGSLSTGAAGELQIHFGLRPITNLQLLPQP